MGRIRSRENPDERPPREVLGRPIGPRALGRVLDRFLATEDLAARVEADPVSLVRRYADPADQEVAGLLVAGLAYGRASVIVAKAGEALARLGAPARGVEGEGPERLQGFVYRFQRGPDLADLARAIGRARAEHGSLAALFLAGVRPDEADYAGAIDRFSLALRGYLARPPSPGVRFLLPRMDGGAGKRWCLYLRWMVRAGGPADPGAWPRLVPGAFDPARLIIPLDTHIQRISRYLGLTDRRTGTLETAREITRSLARLSPEDPLVYDLALCHLGISGRCPRRRHVERCAGCPIRAACRLGEAPRGWRSSR